jgi:hypothetical protein
LANRRDSNGAALTPCGNTQSGLRLQRSPVIGLQGRLHKRLFNGSFALRSVLLFKSGRPEGVGLHIVVHRIEPLAEGDAVELVGVVFFKRSTMLLYARDRQRTRGPAEATRTPRHAPPSYRGSRDDVLKDDTAVIEARCDSAADRGVAQRPGKSVQAAFPWALSASLRASAGRCARELVPKWPVFALTGRLGAT